MTPEGELSDALMALSAAARRGDIVGEIKAASRIARLFREANCGHPERHCPACSGDVEQCREFCRSAASL